MSFNESCHSCECRNLMDSGTTAGMTWRGRGLKMKGYVQVYTGNGKGKTTAALGLALRAAGADLKVYIGQFMKKGKYSELKSLQKLKDNVTVEQFGRARFIRQKIAEEDRLLARRGFEKIKKIIQNGKYDLVILDEINVALSYGLLSKEKVIGIIKSRPKTQEIVLTGRNAPRDIVKLADLVTEMKEIKHYFSKGVKARTGIEK